MIIKPLRIGQIGLGAITDSHRDGYRRFGLPVVAGFDIAAAARERFAKQEPAARAHETLESALHDANVDVWDLAVPHVAKIRLPLAEAVAKTGKPTLIQKPLAEDYATAERIEKIFSDAGVPLMVNQNMCFTGGVFETARLLIDEGKIGRAFLARSNWNWPQDPPVDHWFGKGRRWWTTDLTVHALSVLHLLLGPPETVYCVQGRDVKQLGVTHEGFGHMLLRYPANIYADGLCTTIYSSGTHYAPHDGVAAITLQGPDGIVTLRNCDNVTTTLRANRAAATDAEKNQTLVTKDQWFPNGFGRAMSYFQAALGEKQTPICSGADNLYVMAVVEAAYRSHDENRVVPLKEIMAERYRDSYGPGWKHGYTDWKSPTPDTSMKTFGPVF